jgi:putative membrane protein
MSRMNTGISSIGMLALLAVACGGASTPPSETPASSGTGANDATGRAGVSTPAGQAAASSTSEVGAPEGPTSAATGQLQGAPSPGPGSDVATLAASTSTTLDDAQIAKITDGVNSAEIEQATLARERAQNPEVRRFASMMIEHHGEARVEQAALKLQTADSPLAQQLSEESKMTLESLRAKRGADFDRAYLDAQVAGHQKVLETIGRVLAPQAQTPALRTYLTELEPTVSRHLQQARSARDALQNGAASSSR